MKCLTCKYHRPNPDHCRRFPPTIMMNTENSMFPVVDREGWWCGEYRWGIIKALKRMFTRSVPNTES